MAYIERPKRFKELVEEIALVFNDESKDRCWWEINRSLERGTISNSEYNTLCCILGRI